MYKKFGYSFLLEFSLHAINVYKFWIFNVLYVKLIMFKYVDSSVGDEVVVKQLGEARVVVMQQ